MPYHERPDRERGREEGGVTGQPWVDVEELLQTGTTSTRAPATGDRWRERNEGPRGGPKAWNEYPGYEKGVEESVSFGQTPPTSPPPMRGSDCPDGYEWEDDGSPNGRCKLKDTAFEDNCWRDTDGKVYCKDNPKPQSGGSGSGSGGGSGSGSSGSVDTFTPPERYQFKPWQRPPQTPFELNLKSELESFLGDWDKRVPFSPDVVQAMKTGAFNRSFGRTGSDRDAIEADAIQRGVFRSSHTGQRLDTARRGYQSQYAQDAREIDVTSSVANDAAIFRNRTAALDRAQAHVDREREFLMSHEMNHFERQRGLAEISLAYYNLEQQRWALTQQLNTQRYGIDKGVQSDRLALEMRLLELLGGR